MVTQASIRILVADDEPLARRAVCRALGDDKELEWAGVFGNPNEALRLMLKRQVDIALLDIRMPGLSGLQIARRSAADDLPIIIFVTAYGEFAIEAFEREAFDYVVKPFTQERLSRSIERAKRRVRQLRLTRAAREDNPRRGDRDSNLHKSDTIQGRERSPSELRLLFRASGRTVLLVPSDIFWIEAADYCSILHTSREDYCIRESLSSLEIRLTPYPFVRIHRSAVANAARVQEIRTAPTGEVEMLLRTGERLRVSKARKRAVITYLRNLNREPS
ncbi:MAG: response regulator transcription factor [Phycisphaerales bacterium]|nr:MAG: response regulator transcription factor [Phycisphaerales bacterium]